MSEDARVVKTKGQIRNAFRELAKSKQISSITVSLISKEAKINRSTFYKHYRDQYDLLRESEEDLLRSIGSFAQRGSSIDFKEMLDYFSTKKSEFKAISESLLSPTFTDKIFRYFKQQQPQVIDTNWDFYFSSQFWGVFGIIRCWIKEGFQTSSSDVASIIEKFIEKVEDVRPNI